MSYTQKIECSVSSCAHNCLEDGTCRLDRIRVKPCTLGKDRSPEAETACGSYNYVGELNTVERIGRGNM